MLLIPYKTKQSTLLYVKVLEAGCYRQPLVVVCVNNLMLLFCQCLYVACTCQSVWVRGLSQVTELHCHSIVGSVAPKIPEILHAPWPCRRGGIAGTQTLQHPASVWVLGIQAHA